jgi:CubicO group peptidase (beta-lactamase class C family)
MVTISGTCDAQFSAVHDAFEENFSTRGDLGASVCIYVDGKPVVDLWGGHADGNRTRPWQRDTIACVASTGKAMASLCLLRLVERGAVELDAPVARYWPAFAQAGKSTTLVRWLLSHRAGLPAIRRNMTADAMLQWHPFVRALEEESPWWEPGTQHGYHALTFGFLVGEVVRRVSGKTIGGFFRDEIGLPLQADFHFGVPLEDDGRAAEMFVEPPPPPGEASFFLALMSEPDSIAARAFLNPPRPPQGMNSREWRAAEIPASNGYASARGIARVYAALSLGGALDGVRVVESKTIELATTEQSFGKDAVLGLTSRFGLGFWLPTAEVTFGPNPEAFGHPGRGGSLGCADPVRRIGFGYVPNQYQGASLTKPDARAKALLDAVYQCLR